MSHEAETPRRPACEVATHPDAAEEDSRRDFDRDAIVTQLPHWWWVARPREGKGRASGAVERVLTGLKGAAATPTHQSTILSG